MTTADAALAVEMDLTITVTAVDCAAAGITLDEAWTALVDAGNDPDRMVRHDDYIVVYDSRKDGP